MPGRMGGKRARIAARDNTPGGGRVAASLVVVDDPAAAREANGELVEHAALAPTVRRRASGRSHFLCRTNTSTSLTQPEFPDLVGVAHRIEGLCPAKRDSGRLGMRPRIGATGQGVGEPMSPISNWRLPTLADRESQDKARAEESPRQAGNRAQEGSQ